MNILIVLLAVGLTARLVRLVTVDTIAEKPRAWVVVTAHRLAPRAGRWADTLLSCPYCLSVWVAAGVAASWAVWGHTVAWQAVALAGTASYVAGHAVAYLDVRD